MCEVDHIRKICRIYLLAEVRHALRSQGFSGLQRGRDRGVGKHILIESPYRGRDEHCTRFVVERDCFPTRTNGPTGPRSLSLLGMREGVHLA